MGSTGRASDALALNAQEAPGRPEPIDVAPEPESALPEPSKRARAEQLLARFKAGDLSAGEALRRLLATVHRYP